MKKLLTVFIMVSTLLFLSACSLLEDASNTLEYADKALEHTNTLSAFAQEAPQLVQEAATDPEKKQELEDRLTTLRADIEEFNSLEAPGFAEGLHESFVTKNEEVLQIVDSAMENGELAVETLENSQLFQVIDDLIQLKTQIEELGQ